MLREKISRYSSEYLIFDKFIIKQAITILKLKSMK